MLGYGKVSFALSYFQRSLETYRLGIDDVFSNLIHLELNAVCHKEATFLGRGSCKEESEEGSCLEGKLHFGIEVKFRSLRGEVPRLNVQVQN